MEFTVYDARYNKLSSHESCEVQTTGYFVCMYVHACDSERENKRNSMREQQRVSLAYN